MSTVARISRRGDAHRHEAALRRAALGGNGTGAGGTKPAVFNSDSGLIGGGGCWWNFLSPHSTVALCFHLWLRGWVCNEVSKRDRCFVTLILHVRAPFTRNYFDSLHQRHRGKARGGDDPDAADAFLGRRPRRCGRWTTPSCTSPCLPPRRRRLKPFGLCTRIRNGSPSMGGRRQRGASKCIPIHNSTRCFLPRRIGCSHPRPAPERSSRASPGTPQDSCDKHPPPGDAVPPCAVGPGDTAQVLIERAPPGGPPSPHTPPVYPPRSLSWMGL